jgi:ribonuclease PH
MMGHEQNSGWITAEYNMLPNSSQQRIKRERYGITGRTQEIQRIISRSLRAAVDLNKIGPITILLDCDVLEADGGTRTASITGAYICLIYILNKLRDLNNWTTLPLKGNLAAISVGKVDGEILVDLNYYEDSHAEVDCNIAALSGDKIIEIQATGEGGIFTRDDLNKMIDVSLNVMNILYQKQNDCLKEMGVVL